MKAIRNSVITICLLLALPIAPQAQSAPAVNSTQPMSTGVVKKVDVVQGKISISHGPLINLDMPAMTMLFRVADPKLLQTVKVGDEIVFVAGKINGAITVTRMEQAKAAAPSKDVSASSVRPAPAANAGTGAIAAATPPTESAAVKMPVEVAQGKSKLGKRSDPADPTATGSHPAYQSAFSDYQAADEVNVAPENIWRAANDEMARLGGHTGQTAEAVDGMEQPVPDAAQVKDKANSPAMPGAHNMQNMNKEK